MNPEREKERKRETKTTNLTRLDLRYNQIEPSRYSIQYFGNPTNHVHDAIGDLPSPSAPPRSPSSPIGQPFPALHSPPNHASHHRTQRSPPNKLLASSSLFFPSLPNLPLLPLLCSSLHPTSSPLPTCSLSPSQSHTTTPSLLAYRLRPTYPSIIIDNVLHPPRTPSLLLLY